ncbi:riboflavin synthase [Lipingzhangella sp. LS1_29]|uniref:Riboflavin synthase n=1 Tax=Lipingzhangella rawalii TaxID=2055835 RepID=A0ABU2H3P8_9ACTN|nr:riboflavin synthase [Lipingzhangella rawalii]MDS1269450.1 riboflavin synthase [Lipingzhangella rawalii]
MFTGIVAELGEVVEVTEHADAGGDVAATQLMINGPTVTSDVAHGDSIAVNGVCLTVTRVDGTRFTADVMDRTLNCSNLGQLRVGARVNLERAARAADRLDGHIVQGHVDGTGQVLQRSPGRGSTAVRISLPAHLARYVVAKGSVTVDGVSLTVAELDDASFTVSLVPTTLELTTLGFAEPGDAVNLEVDVLAKYVERLMSHTIGQGVTR